MRASFARSGFHLLAGNKPLRTEFLQAEPFDEKRRNKQMAAGFEFFNERASAGPPRVGRFASFEVDYGATDHVLHAAGLQPEEGFRKPVWKADSIPKHHEKEIGVSSAAKQMRDKIAGF
jgi:hypothetical protein